MRWLKNVWCWLRSFPRPWAVVRLNCAVLNDKGIGLTVGPGVSLEIVGDVLNVGGGYAITTNGGDLTIRGDIRNL
jgi:hypothetical protein